MKYRTRFWLLLAALVVAVPGVLAQDKGTADPAKKDEKPRYEFRDKHDIDGIGKFYMGREIAHVVGPGAAAWLDRPTREKEEQLTKMVGALKLQPGDVVADVGAGSGRISFMMCDKVGAKGKVYAEDIQKELLDLIRARAKAKKVANIDVVQGTDKDPKLAENSLDMILMVDVYHEFAFPFEMTEGMVKALKSGGRLIFVEYRMEDDNVPIKLVHKMTQAQVKKEMEPHPLTWSETIDVLPWQHIIIFKKK